MFNKKLARQALRYLFIILMFFAVCAFQTSFWPFTISFLPSPPLWIIIITFIIIRFPLYTGIFFVYFLGLILTRFTFLPLKIIWTGLNMVYISVWSIKNRISSTGFRSFAGLCALSYVLFYIFQLLLSAMLEDNRISINIIVPIIETGLVYVLSAPLYFILDFIDTQIVGSHKWETSRYETKDELI